MQCPDCLNGKYELSFDPNCRTCKGSGSLYPLSNCKNEAEFLKLIAASLEETNELYSISDLRKWLNEFADELLK